MLQHERGRWRHHRPPRAAHLRRRLHLRHGGRRRCRVRRSAWRRRLRCGVSRRSWLPRADLAFSRLTRRISLPSAAVSRRRPCASRWNTRRQRHYAHNDDAWWIWNPGHRLPRGQCGNGVHQRQRRWAAARAPSAESAIIYSNFSSYIVAGRQPEPHLPKVRVVACHTIEWLRPIVQAAEPQPAHAPTPSKSISPHAPSS